MRLAVDAERIRDPHSGLGQFCGRLARELIRQKPPAAGLTFLVPPGRSGEFGGDVAYVEATAMGRIRSPVRSDVWHATHQDSAFRAGAARTVLTIHDLNFLRRSDYGRLHRAARLAAVQRRIDRASAITAISEFTAATVREHLDVDGRPIHVIYNGNPLEPDGEEATSPPPALVDPAALPFFLFVGALHPRKNLHVLVPLLRQLPDRRLVLAGPAGHAYAGRLRADARRLGVDARVVMTGAVDDAARRWLYHHCEALLFPSLAEGFGLPAIEAMGFGRPVFLSRCTSLPEIGGPDAYYFDSFDPADMAGTIARGLASFAADAGAADRLRRRAARFTWRRAAADYWALYLRTLAGAP
jgi:glycosyltransferase involved in cell wall biosynthesis